MLLSKSDQLSRSEGLNVLRQVQAQLEGIASAQLFSSLKGVGLEEARSVLKRWASRDAGGSKPDGK